MKERNVSSNHRATSSNVYHGSVRGGKCVTRCWSVAEWEPPVQPTKKELATFTRQWGFAAWIDAEGNVVIQQDDDSPGYEDCIFLRPEQLEHLLAWLHSHTKRGVS